MPAIAIKVGTVARQWINFLANAYFWESERVLGWGDGTIIGFK